MKWWTDSVTRCVQCWAVATGNPDLSGREVVARQLGECGFKARLLQPDSC